MGIYNLGGGGGAPELQAKEATPLITNAQQIILPDDGYDGLSKVTVNPMPTGALKTPTVNSIGYVSSGVQTAGYLDTSATSGLQLSTQEAKTITPTTYSQTAVASGKYTTGAVMVAGDANLVSSNIVAGKSIFGVSGSLKEHKTMTMQFNVPSRTQYISIPNINLGYLSFFLLDASVASESAWQEGDIAEYLNCYRGQYVYWNLRLYGYRRQSGGQIYWETAPGDSSTNTGYAYLFGNEIRLQLISTLYIPAGNHYVYIEGTT